MSDFWKTLPAGPGPAREAVILDAVNAGVYEPVVWAHVESEYNGHKARLQVTADCLRLGGDSGSVRVSVTAITAQAIADVLGCYLPTTRICDLVWKQAKVHLEPCLFGEPRSATSRMRDYHEAVEAAVAGRKGLIENVGKHWVVTNKLLTSPGKAANYGFFSSKAPNVSASGLRMWQTLGTAHNGSHVDYSQVVRLVNPDVLVDGKLLTFKDVATNPALAGLVSSEGILRTLRASPQAAGGSSLVRPPPDVTPAALLAIHLPLAVGSKGEDVKVWQRFVGVGDDGSFGPVTGGATELFRSRAGLPKGRMVDKAALDAALAQLHTELVVDGPGDAPLFVQAKNYTKANRTAAHWIVIHTMEAAEKGTTAEAVAEYFRTTTRQASAHFCIDSDSVVQCVRLKDIAWCAPGANRDGIHFEHAGYARQSALEWADSFSTAMLEKSAELAAQVAKEYKIPLQYINREELKAARKLQDAGQPVPDSLRGVTTHNEVSQAFKQSTHYDPGPNFPMEAYLTVAKLWR